MGHLLRLMLALGLLVACNGPSTVAERQPPAASAPPVTSGTAGTSSEVGPTTTTNGTADAAGWDTVVWEGLALPVPPGATFERATVAAPAAYGQPMINAAHVIAPDSTGVARATAQFLLLEFDGTLDDWLMHIDQQQQPQSVGSLPLLVDQATIRHGTIANQPAITYRLQQGETIEPVEHSALKLAPDRLLVITVLDPADPAAQQVIARLQTAS